MKGGREEGRRGEGEGREGRRRMGGREGGEEGKQEVEREGEREVHVHCIYMYMQKGSEYFVSPFVKWLVLHIQQPQYGLLVTPLTILGRAGPPWWPAVPYQLVNTFHTTYGRKKKWSPSTRTSFFSMKPPATMNTHT